jgi:hypothetical protein
MNKANGLLDRITMALGIALLAATAFTGCLGVIGDDGGYYGGEVVVPGPDLYLFGGGYDRGRDVHGYSHRGSESRGAAHPAGRGGGGGGHEGGGHGGGERR